MLLQGQVVSAVPRARTSGNPNAEQLWLGELGISQVMPRYSALAKSGLVFTARGATQLLSLAGVAMTGLVLWNSSSLVGGVDLHILKASGNIVVTSATTTGIAIAYGKNQATTPTGTVFAQQNCDYIGGSSGSGVSYTSATFANAPVAQFDVLHNTAAIAASGEDAGFLIDFEGSIIVPPQQYIAFVALGAATAAAATNLSIKWAELAV